MLTTRVLINDWVPPNQRPREATTAIDLVEVEQAEVRTHHDRNHSNGGSAGVAYQRCGGGRRVIRKRVGNS